jgi:hypothetical protein
MSQAQPAIWPSSGLLDRLSHWFSDRNELSALPKAEVERMAQDLGMSASELRDVSARGPHAADLLRVRMAALGLTEADIDRLAFGLIRDLERDCACCASKAECREDLAKHAESPGWMAYCANAQTLDAAASMKGRAPI